MVVKYWYVFAFKANHQPAGRQSISQASLPLSRLLLPSVSITVDSCHSQRANGGKKKSHNTTAVA